MALYFQIAKDYFRILTIYSNMYHTPEKRPLQGSIKHYEDMIHRDLEKRGTITKIGFLMCFFSRGFGSRGPYCNKNIQRLKSFN